MSFLNDCGASHSFISPQCTQHLELEVVPLDSRMAVDMTVDISEETS